MKTLLIILCALAFTACNWSLKVGDKEVGKQDNGAESFSYDFTCGSCGENCHTSHSFNSKSDYCGALVNEDFNSGKCRYMREQAHKDNCG